MAKKPTGEVDLVIVEETGRLVRVRGSEAVRLRDVAAEHGVSIIAHIDTPEG